MMQSLASPLYDEHASNGAVFEDYHGAAVPARFSNALAEYQAVRNTAGLFDFSFRAKLIMRGEHCVRFLHRIVSNDVKNLAPGRGIYATLLNPQGHILVDLRIYNTGDSLILDTDADLANKAAETLRKYIIGDRVELEAADLWTIAAQGPESRGVVERALTVDVSPLANEGDHLVTDDADKPVRVVRRSSTGDEGYEVWAPRQDMKCLWTALCTAGALPCGTEALETLRIEAGIPRYGAELGEDTIPLEANLLDALSFNKGCYIGQEIVERARSRGHVNWRLVGLAADAQLAAGDKIEHEGRVIGEVTSSCVSPALGKPIALAYVRREVAEAGTKLNLGAGATAEVIPLPFYHRLSGAAGSTSANQNPSRSTISPSSTASGA